MPAYVVVAPSAGSQLKSKEGRDKLTQELKKFVTDNKIRYKALAEVEYLDAIPKTPSGKLLRKDCEFGLVSGRRRNTPGLTSGRRPTVRVMHAQSVKKRAEKL